MEEFKPLTKKDFKTPFSVRTPFIILTLQLIIYPIVIGIEIGIKPETVLLVAMSFFVPMAFIYSFILKRRFRTSKRYRKVLFYLNDNGVKLGEIPGVIGVFLPLYIVALVCIPIGLIMFLGFLALVTYLLAFVCLYGGYIFIMPIYFFFRWKKQMTIASVYKSLWRRARMILHPRFMFILFMKNAVKLKHLSYFGYVAPLVILNVLFLPFFLLPEMTPLKFLTRFFTYAVILIQFAHLIALRNFIGNMNYVTKPNVPYSEVYNQYEPRPWVNMNSYLPPPPPPLVPLLLPLLVPPPPHPLLYQQQPLFQPAVKKSSFKMIEEDDYI